MRTHNKPALFGIKNTNRDFSKKASWGKNQFNTAFPVALTCYMDAQGHDPVYLCLGLDKQIDKSNISARELFGLPANSAELYFAFERDYAPYQTKIINGLPRIDLVTVNTENNSHLCGLEIKLTALPDNSTCNLTEDKYGSELVIRPDTIVYLALSIITKYSSDDLSDLLSKACDNVLDWTDEREMLTNLPELVTALEAVIVETLDKQIPLVIQPIWKTQGKSPELANHCLDIFIWSNLGFTRLFIDATLQNITNGASTINRQMRTTLWLIKMLYDYSQNGRIDWSWVVDQMTFNTKNDKAFAVNGQVTHNYMMSPELLSPRILKTELKNIILNGGHKLLSPERRFDAIIFYSSDLFDE